MERVCQICAAELPATDASATSGGLSCAGCAADVDATAPRPAAKSSEKRPTAEIVIAAEASAAHRAYAGAPAQDRRRRVTAAAPSRRSSASFRRVVGAICAGALVSLTIAGRERIVAKIPVMDRVFAALGVPVNLVGVEFRDVSSKITDIDGRKVLAVEGEVTNIRRSEASLAGPLKLTVRAADGRALYVWTAEAPKSKLAAGESVRFRTRLAAPPEDGRDVAVTLSDTGRPGAPARREALADMARRMVR